MKNFLKLLILGLIVISCRSSDNSKYIVQDFNPFTGLQLQNLIEDSLSIRSIKIINDKIWYGSQQGRYGVLNFEGQILFEGVIERNNEPHPIRGVASDGKYVYLMGIQKPAAIYRHLITDLSVFEKVYEDQHPEAFLNSLVFDENGKGLAYGDSYDQDVYVLKTKDGQSWERVKSHQLPKMENGEHAFAASNSVAFLFENKIWLATGGSQARVFHSYDFGDSWQIQNPTIVFGSHMKGIFSMDFYDDKIGLAAGGDYDKPNFSKNNLAITYNGGKLWQEVSYPLDKLHPGFISCIKFVPDGYGEHLVSIGSNGIFYSFDGAKNWKKFSEESNLYTLEFINENRAVAAGKNKIVLLDFTRD